MLQQAHKLSIRDKIGMVRSEIAACRKEATARVVPRRCMPSKVYYDQMEELHSTLAKLRLKAAEEDSLEKWCETHPSDLECRVYE